MTGIPFRMVEFYPDHFTHGHSYFCEDGESMEEAATALAEAVMMCSEDRHQGHGRTHSLQDAQDAFTAAQLQWVFKDDERQWNELQVKMAHYKKWGGQAPEVVVVPSADDPRKWQAIVKHPVTGEATIYETQPDWAKELPDPREFGMRPNPDGPGWVRPRA